MVEKNQQNELYIKSLESKIEDLKKKLIESQKIQDEMLSYTKDCQPIVVKKTVNCDILKNFNIDFIIREIKQELMEQVINNVQIIQSLRQNNYANNPLYSESTISAVLYIKRKLVE